jgi:hypothetical protein
MANVRLYKKTYPAKAEKLCRELGLTDEQLAEVFEVSVRSIQYWKGKYPEFLAAVQRGKDDFDSDVVEKCLLKRATGYTTHERTYEMGTSPVLPPPEAMTPGKLYVVQQPQLQLTRQVEKEIAPDVAAQIFWLKNRRPDRWREKTEVTINELDQILAGIAAAEARHATIH